eukprot:CAMPEP_0172639776 /NCGR_PEP_ID=MMETSP1068-20121228/219857_1 /TAXON_ID=35684 /ORGANISM="Pseudopedinella elastica, Strain CCMP716" /LENGTH=43 /DNA_ID= /DNA_START= /DNA_END= /DNA_ORIENTATION=
MDHQRDWTGSSPGVLVWVSDQDEVYVPGVIKKVTNGTNLVVSL